MVVKDYNITRIRLDLIGMLDSTMVLMWAADLSKRLVKDITINALPTTKQ